MLRSAMFILFVAFTAISADFECPETEGILSDPDDCRSFYQGAGNLDDFIRKLINCVMYTFFIIGFCRRMKINVFKHFKCGSWL